MKTATLSKEVLLSTLEFVKRFSNESKNFCNLTHLEQREIAFFVQSAIQAERKKAFDIANNCILNKMVGSPPQMVISKEMYKQLLEVGMPGVEAIIQTTTKPPYGTPGRQFIENAERFVEKSSK